VKKILMALIIPILLAGCGRLQSIPHDPPLTPETWCQVQPCMHVTAGPVDFVLAVPTSTFFVYLLGVLAIIFGARVFRALGGERSRAWLGVGLLFWGAGALLAGTSYQAFSWEIKCAGREVCAWTSWWEIYYLVCTVISVSAFTATVAYSCTRGRGRKTLLAYAGVNVSAYLSVVFAGAFIPNALMVSFELMLLFTAPVFLVLFTVSALRYRRLRDRMDRAFMFAWSSLGIVTGVYFFYLVMGWTEQLWARGIWFCANDVLHIGLIAWMLFMGAVLPGRLKDAAGS
jgi:hypothetical protein